MSIRINKNKKLAEGMIHSLACKYKVNIKLITEFIVARLMDDQDILDFQKGLLSDEVLKLHVKVWVKSGMPDYRHGKTLKMLSRE